MVFSAIVHLIYIYVHVFDQYLNYRTLTTLYEQNSHWNLQFAVLLMANVYF